mmetsp:Transcript_4872/g.5649  ORF Transcript_4872/g.5649 Transcript_4872/m.5649 type:complete len:86 (-) Transcript_4872:145-402(-)
MGLESLLQKIPGGPRVQVFVGTAFILGLSAIPIWYNPKQKKGHDLFSQDKPEAFEKLEDQRRTKFREARKQQRQQEQQQQEQQKS